MSDRYEYVDEDGNPIPLGDLDGDYEIIEEVVEEEAVEARAATPAPAPQGPAAVAATPDAVRRIPKAVLIVGAVVVLGLGGAVAYGMSQIGGQNTVGDIKDGAQQKVAAASSSVVAKKEEVTKPAEIDACNDLSKAKWGGLGSGEPSMRLKIIDSAPLPAGFVERMEVADGKYWVAQTGRDTWTVSVKNSSGAGSDGRWWVVEADTTDDAIRMTEGPAERSGKDITGACVPRVSTAGAYQVVGDVPTSAEGLRDDQVQSYAIQASGGDESIVVGVLGDHLATMELEYAPAPDDDDR